MYHTKFTQFRRKCHRDPRTPGQAPLSVHAILVLGTYAFVLLIGDRREAALFLLANGGAAIILIFDNWFERPTERMKGRLVTACSFTKKVFGCIYVGIYVLVLHRYTAYYIDTSAL